MRDQVGAAHATSWDNLWGGLRSARNALNSSHTGRKPRPPLGVLWSQIALNFDFFVATLLQPGNEDVTLKALVKPELLFAAGQVRQVLLNIGGQFSH